MNDFNRLICMGILYKQKESTEENSKTLKKEKKIPIFSYISRSILLNWIFQTIFCIVQPLFRVRTIYAHLNLYLYYLFIYKCI